MRWIPACLVVLAGCAGDPLAPAPGEPAGVHGVRTVSQEREFDRMAREAAKWDASLPKGGANQGIIGVSPGLERSGAERAPRAGADAGLQREVEVLAARVDRLERAAAPSASVGPAQATASKSPALSIYKVSPDGRTAWISSGSSSGLKDGLAFQVRRGEAIVGQVQIARVWPEVSELSVLWSNGVIQSGDSAIAVEGGESH